MAGSSLLPTRRTISIVQPKMGAAPMRVYVNKLATANFFNQFLSLKMNPNGEP